MLFVSRTSQKSRLKAGLGMDTLIGYYYILDRNRFGREMVRRDRLQLTVQSSLVFVHKNHSRRYHPPEVRCFQAQKASCWQRYAYS